MILQRFRVAMVRAEREQLSGDVGVDATLVGGVEHGGKPGRGTDNASFPFLWRSSNPRGLGGCTCAIFLMLQSLICDHLLATW